MKIPPSINKEERKTIAKENKKHFIDDSRQ